jgi:DNA-binding CsgD family transcriptional regulator
VSDVDGLVRRGRLALAAADWATARSCFATAATHLESAEILDGLGQALCWLGAYDEGLPLRERGYALYLEHAEYEAAALAAVQLAALHWLVYGNDAAASGWVAHAQRMAEQAGDCSASGWVELLLASGADDLEERARRCAALVESARRLGDPALEFDAMAAVGQTLVARGEIDEGMRLIDESVAAVASGVVTDPWATAEIYCKLFGACELAVDVRRARQWLQAVDHYVERTQDVPTAGICRMHFGGVLTAAGRWADAERELLAATGIYNEAFRGARYEPLARLADLRVRQGRLEEAAQLLEGLTEHPEAVQPTLRLHLARGEPVLAAHVARRHLRRRGRGLASAWVLALLVEAELARGHRDGARAVAQELAELAATTGQSSLEGLAAWSQARVAAANGDDAAIEQFELALSSFTAVGLPHELGRVHLELATLLATSEREPALLEARAALTCFESLGAVRDADAAAVLLRDLGDRKRAQPRGQGPLTKREAEVLGLVAEGLSNAEISERLFISVRTAEHHVAKIMAKLGVNSRTQAAAVAMRAAAGRGRR